MAWRDDVVRSLTTVRADGSTAVDVGAFTPNDGATNYPASVTLWTADGSQYLALAIQDVGLAGHPVGYLGLGSKATNTWTPTVKFYNGGGLSLMADRSVGQAA